MGDILDDLGKKTVSEFIAKYGSENAVFVCCDNTKDEDIKGTPFNCDKLISLTFVAPCGHVTEGVTQRNGARLVVHLWTW